MVGRKHQDHKVVLVLFLSCTGFYVLLRVFEFVVFVISYVERPLSPK
jgi:hypothetical protein